MAIDKELFYASHGLKYPVVARPYTDDMEVKEKFFTKADMVAMLTEIQLEIEEQKRDELSYQQTWNYPLNVCVSIIQQKINALKEQKDETDKSNK